MEGAPGKALEAVLGKPWGHYWGELLRKPLRHGSLERWGGGDVCVGAGWSGLMLSLLPPLEDGKIYINMPGRG